MGLSNFTVKTVIKTTGVDTDKSFSNKTETLDTPVYGVQRKCGHIVSFKNEYEAAVEIINAGLSIQDAYYVKNDIRRSIKEDNYGVGTYKWFRTYDEAKCYSMSLEDKNRYSVDTIIGSPFVKVSLIRTYRQERVDNSKLYRQQVKSDLDSIPLNTLEDRDTLARLLLNNTVNQIAQHYNISFHSMQNRLKRLGLPCDKYEIAEYRKTGIIKDKQVNKGYSKLKEIDTTKIPNEYPPTRETLEYLIINHPIAKIARLYEVSFSTITRLLQKNNLPYMKDDIDKFRNRYLNQEL